MRVTRWPAFASRLGALRLQMFDKLDFDALLASIGRLADQAVSAPAAARR